MPEMTSTTPTATRRPAGQVPLWLKVAYTAFVAVLVPAYARQYPLANFLWFSDIALLLTVPALWLESRLLMTMQAIALMITESVWTADFISRLIGTSGLLGMTDYMFDPNIPLLIRGLSLFHLFLPPMVIWLSLRLGPHPRALLAQTLLAWTVILIVYCFTAPSLNINWVFGPGNDPQTRFPSWLYLIAVMICLPLFLYLPPHLMLQWVARRIRRSHDQPAGHRHNLNDRTSRP